MGDLKCVVTGGRGLVGRHLVLKLLKEEKLSVTVADIGPKIEVCAEEEEEGTLGVALESGKVEYVCVDVRSKRELVEIFRDVAVVFHTADMESFVDNFQLHYDVTVSGTRNVIDVRESSSDPHCIFWCCHIWWRFYCDKNPHFVLTFLTKCVGVLLQLVLGCPYLEGKG